MLAHVLVALAARSFGTRRGLWGQAMQAELDFAIEDGRPLAFALGCLAAAWRELPRFSEGRLALTIHALAIGLIVPLGALALWAALVGYPYLAFGNVGVWGFIAGRSQEIPLLLVGERALAPAMTLVVLLEAVGQLLLAWYLLERDWSRVLAIGRLNAATLTTLLMVTMMLAIAGTDTLVAVAALITETLAVLSLAWWHDDLPEPAPAAVNSG
jgi:hypothetical protein